VDLFPRRRGTGKPVEDCAANNLGRLDALRFLAWKGERTHAGAGCAGIDDVDAYAPEIGGLVCVSPEQSFERCFRRLVCSPKGPRLGPYRGGENNHVGLFRLLEQRVESSDECLVRQQVKT